MNTFTITWRFRLPGNRLAATATQDEAQGRDALAAGDRFIDWLLSQHGIQARDIVIQEIRPVGVVK